MGTRGGPARLAAGRSMLYPSLALRSFWMTEVRRCDTPHHFQILPSLLGLLSVPKDPVKSRSGCNGQVEREVL